MLFTVNLKRIIDKGFVELGFTQSMSDEFNICFLIIIIIIIIISLAFRYSSNYKINLPKQIPVYLSFLTAPSWLLQARMW